MIWAVAAATALALVAIHCWRRWVDPMAVVGPVPASLEPMAWVVIGAINIAAAALVVAIFSADSRSSRFRCVVFGVTGTVLGCFRATVARSAE